KLRMAGNSIRLRLSQGEVRQFAESGRVEETVRFAENTLLTYVLEKGAGDALSARLEGSKITVEVPDKKGMEWAKTDLVGIEGSLEITPGERLKILVEKDFKCLAPRAGEDESDNFPHPKEGDIKC
ncbi:MAG: hypothetical protein D6714_15690, partial [Bacteroidetes bacterium]